MVAHSGRFWGYSAEVSIAASQVADVRSVTDYPYQFMYELTIKPEWLIQAQKEASSLGELNNSIRHGEGNVYGFLGEIILCNITAAVLDRTYDYDIIYDGKKIDVKTKCCTSTPRPEYFCSVADYNTRQQCDYYTFMRILKDFSKAWVLGTISKEDFFKQATFGKKGELDPTSNLGWRFKADCFNLPVSALKGFYRLRKNL